MAIVRWEPFREAERAFRGAEQMFTYWPRLFGAEARNPAAEWAPLTDIGETDKEYVIKVELPEVQKEDVKLLFEDGVITLSGERKHEKEARGEKMHRAERFYGSFVRSFELPADADGDHIRADSKDGVLTVRIPKIESRKAKPRQIEVH
jgi:HSP20 family protein